MNTTSLFRLAALFRAALLCGVLSACGGGGDAPGPVDPPAPPPPAAAPPAPAPAPAPSFAFLLQANKVEVCEIDSSDLLRNCVETGGLVGYQALYAMAVAGSHAYIANLPDASPSAIIHCNITATGMFSSCAETGPSNLVFPYGLTIHGSTLYIGDYSSPPTHKCEITPDGSLDNCMDAGFPDTAIDVEDLRIAGSTAYLLHYDNQSISRCDVLDDGTFSGCADAGATGLSGPEGFAIKGDHMYIANSAGDSVTRCIIADDGSLSDCVDSGAPGLATPSQVAVRGSNVYISNFGGTGVVTRCTAAIDGLLTNCESITSEPRALIGIYFR